MTEKKILVVCSSNSIRSQIAEGFFKHFCNNSIEVMSAGIQASYVHPLAIAVMQEKAIDLSQQTSTDIRDLLNIHFDYVITVCENAKKLCPQFSNNTVTEHWDIRDPSAVSGDNEAIMRSFREVRDDIEKRVLTFLYQNNLIAKSES
ncbi:arsenate reductase ArsC [candidate division KSB1 bacterium]